MTLTQEFIERVGAHDVFDACRAVVGHHFGEFLNSESGTDLAALTDSIGVKVQYARDIPYEGCIERDELGRASIIVRAGLNRRRERFTMAHELGHWALQEQMLGTCEGKLFRGVSANDQEMKEEESLANLLAAELLLPMKSVANRFRSDAIHGSLNDICRHFVVSRTMALRRIADVVGHNIAVVQLMPYDFGDFSSRAQVDDAMFVTSRMGTLFARDSTTLCHPVRYNDVLNGISHRLDVLCPKGLVSTEFECLHRDSPVPHSYCIALVESWPKR